MIVKALFQFVSALPQIVYPPVCEICRCRVPSEQVLCSDCSTRLTPQSSPFCLRCAEQTPEASGNQPRCSTCQSVHFHFRYAIVPYLMDTHLRHLIHLFKYQKGLHLASFLGGCLAEVLLDERLQGLDLRDWALASVPVHPTRERTRGFDQAEILARELEKHSGIPYMPCLERVKYTPHQTKLNRKERALNMRHAFQLKPTYSAPPEKVFLIDDVFTTGATVNACAKILKDNGVKEVIVLCLTRK